MKKKLKPQQIADKSLTTLLKIIQRDIQTIKIDLKMIKIDYVLKDSQLGLSFRGFTRELEQTNKEVRKLQTDVDNLAIQVVTLDEKVDDTTQAIHDEAKQYRNDLMTKLDSIAGSIKTFQEEHDILAYRQTDHGQRINKLETAVFPKPSE